MSLFASLKQHLESGDPTLRKWFLVQQSWIPFVCSALYVFYVRQLGPYLMRQRQPMELRKSMVVYNFSLVAVYVYAACVVLYYSLTMDYYNLVCKIIVVRERTEIYKICSAIWLIYALKYVEYADTVFYILRKKFDLISHLHVIHHAAVPIIYWFLFRCETTGFQVIPAVINAFVHIIMYTYYGLSAMGPKFQKILWWKRYLTLLQMTQFVVIIFLMFVVAPAIGCKTSREGARLVVFFAALFLLLFYNYYAKTYKKPLYVKSSGDNPKVVYNSAQKSVYCKSRKDN